MGDKTCDCGWDGGLRKYCDAHNPCFPVQATRDRSPIDQRWIQNYCDQLLKVAGTLPERGVIREATMRRVECVMDLVEAWQKKDEAKR